MSKGRPRRHSNIIIRELSQITLTLSAAKANCLMEMQLVKQLTETSKSLLKVLTIETLIR